MDLLFIRIRLSKHFLKKISRSTKHCEDICLINTANPLRTFSLLLRTALIIFACLAAKEANNHWTVSSNADRLDCYESHINSYNNCISTQSILDQQRSIIDNHIPSKRGFKLASLNVNKLSTHIDEIRILLADKCLDVLAIQETKLDVSNNNSDCYICGYELIRRDRLSDGGGGICFYIKSTINFSVRTDLNVDELENLCIEIRKPNSKPFIVVNWYRPPNSPIGLFSHLENLIARLDLTNLEFFLLGDMNADMASTNYDNNVRQLINIADIYGRHQLISEPTRITDKSSTLIDLIYTNCP